MTRICGLVFIALTPAGYGAVLAQSAPAITAESIMTQVAKHQDEAQEERSHYIYVQHAKMTARGGHEVKCEEITDYRIAPTADGSTEELLKVDGRVLIDHKYVQYSALLPSDDSGEVQLAPKARDDESKVPDSQGGDGIDRNLVENMRKNLLNNKSKDGIEARLFPLTSKLLDRYLFTLAGREHLNGRDVFHVKFRPKDKKDFGWKGDAYIDVEAYQPVLVTTDMARKVPFAVRTLLGTNVPGLGFTVTYAPQPDGPWFPVSFATEFKLDVLFFFRREIILNAQNIHFEKTHGETRILDEATPVDPSQP